MEIPLIYQNMSNKAKGIGAAIIAIEHDMNRVFANKTITEEYLNLMLDKSARLYGQVRFVHLSAHLDTLQMLTMAQVQRYNKMGEFLMQFEEEEMKTFETVYHY
jgi:hypothetical protein